MSGTQRTVRFSTLPRRHMTLQDGLATLSPWAIITFARWAELLIEAAGSRDSGSGLSRQLSPGNSPTGPVRSCSTRST
jgi:hypothetical protein